MAKKQNPLLAQLEAMYERQYQVRLHEALRLSEDAAVISADEAVGITEEQAVELRRLFRENLGEIVKLIIEDSNDDPDIVWTRAKVDRRLMEIEGKENFRPWDERHM